MPQGLFDNTKKVIHQLNKFLFLYSIVLFIVIRFYIQDMCISAMKCLTLWAPFSQSKYTIKDFTFSLFTLVINNSLFVIAMWSIVKLGVGATS